MSNNCECGNKVTPFRYASKEIFFTNNLKFVLLDINIRNNKNSLIAFYGISRYVTNLVPYNAGDIIFEI
jgi:hypothetical protein